ncbi:Fur family transcriptional regulator [Tepidanaerobacter syntrophicus]|uniref:Fur family transcriptional regulator n=2 Tax=Tepidanaerobacter syntrophicus TaxID=224999 RepID=A0A0U9HGY9_9FIRM|nr:Fur family transcriptional regulator [Tepidanaerobacter syntrophicus]GAQ26105.1 Fur family transcriptional regulator [Tepidanaerobacter syntrophicus]
MSEAAYMPGVGILLTEEERKYRISVIEDRLKEKDLKLTPQRRVVLDVLLDNQSKHLSAEEVFEFVRKKFPDIGLATVYRTLQLFDDFGVIKKLDFNDGCYRYELSEDQRHQHHHLICIKCGKIYEFDDDLLEDLEKRIYKNNSFKVIDHAVKFFGYCKDCLKDLT